jgi:carbon storage regulator
VGERIKIGDDVEITILAINGRGVRVGIDAPKEVTVLRSELLRESEASDD